MKQNLIALLLAGLLLVTGSGCSSVFEDEYYYEEPVTGGFGAMEGNATEIRNLSMLKTAITGMISRHEEHQEFRLSNYNGSPSEDLAAACFEIKSNHPLGAYAVENISYDTSYVVSYYMTSIDISYKRSTEELESIVYALSQGEFDESIYRSLGEFSPQALVRLYSTVVDEEYIRHLVHQRYLDDPVAMVMEPQVEVTTYPSEGANRIFDIHFSYGATQALNMALSLSLSNRLNAAAAELTETEPLYLALEGAEYLCELCGTEPEGTYADTAYGALVEHAANSKGMALAYLVLCRQMELPCIVVEGRSRAMGMEPHYWNMITLNGENYHVDLTGMAADPGNAFLCSDDSFWDTYIWETEDYPACCGSLTYGDAAREEPAPPEEEVQDDPENELPPDDPQPTEPPQEEVPPEEPEEQTEEIEKIP